MWESRFCAIAFLLLGQVALRAQTLPPLLPGEIPTPVARAETGKQDVLSMGIRVANQFDDNALNDDAHKRGNLLTLLEPHVGWTLSLPRATWILSYRPGFSIGHPVSIYNSRSHVLDTDLQLKLTERLQLRLRESLLQSKNVFDQLQQSELQPGSVLDRPNNSIFAAIRQSSEQAGGDLSYDLNSRTAIGASASFYHVNYDSALTAQALGATTSVGAHAFSSYRLSRHHRIGFDYNVQNLVSRRPQSRSLVQSIFYTDTRALRPSMTVSFFLGPQHLLTHSEAGIPSAGAGGPYSARASWSWAGGASFLWSNTRTTLIVGLSRRVSDGGGLDGIVQLLSANAELRRQIASRWKGRLLLSDNRNQALVSGFVPLSYVSFAGGLSRALNQRFSVEWQYWHAHETTSALSGSYLADHNRTSISLQYDLKVPLQQ